MRSPHRASLELSDYELLKPAEGSVPVRPTGSGWLPVAVALLIVAASVAAYIVLGGRKAPPPAAAKQAGVEVRQQTVRPLGGDADPIALPSLDQTDPVVRDLLRQITSHPRVAAWLATDGLIRNFVVVVSNVADGRSPAPQLRVLQPPPGFHVTERDGGVYIDPRSYRRYDALAAAAASVDPAGAARVYTMLKPRIEDAYRELGGPEPFDRTFERAIVRLLETPQIEEPVRAVRQGGIAYAFSTPDLEALPAAQKQLLRTGPDNLRTIRSSIRAVALALGIPSERLPKPPSH